MKNIIKFIKQEIVLVAALLLAVVSSFWNPLSGQYIEYIDFRVLGMLLSLMLVVAGLQEKGVFHLLGERLLEKCSNTWNLNFVLVFFCFFSSMFLTNDVALITFVPFAILTLRMAGQEKQVIQIVSAQTVAANLGSMLTPMGNPQNLYLYSLSNMQIGDFIKLMLPYTLAAGLLLCIMLLLTKKEPININFEKQKQNEITGINKKQICIYLVLFLLCLCTVLRLLEWYIVLSIIVAVFFVLDRHILKKADYCLLLTFIGFFLFIGNIRAITAVKEMLSALIKGKETIIAVITSQIISNVPAAILLSGFTENCKALIVGTNLGGLGTLIASMASLISYKQLANTYPEKKGKYLAYFTIVNFMFLMILLFFDQLFI